MGNQRKNFLVYLGVISVIIAGFFILFDGGIGSTEEIPMSSVISLTENPPIGQRVNILVKGDELEIISGNQTYTSRKEPGSSIYKILQDAEYNDLLKIWEGLGYYSRCKNIFKTSQLVNSSLPNNYEDLIKLPGIGDYTAKAILSIAFKKPYVSITNSF